MVKVILALWAETNSTQDQSKPKNVTFLLKIGLNYVYLSFSKKMVNFYIF